MSTGLEALVAVLQTHHRNWEERGQPLQSELQEYNDYISILQSTFSNLVVPFENIRAKSNALVFIGSKDGFRAKIKEINELTTKLLIKQDNAEVKVAAAAVAAPTFDISAHSPNIIFKTNCALHRDYGRLGTLVIVQTVLQRMTGHNVELPRDCTELKALQELFLRILMINNNQATNERAKLKQEFRSCLGIIVMMQNHVNYQKIHPILKGLKQELETFLQDFNPDISQAGKCKDRIKLNDMMLQAMLEVTNEHYCLRSKHLYTSLDWNKLSENTKMWIREGAEHFIGKSLDKIEPQEWPTHAESLIAQLLLDCNHTLYKFKYEDVATLALYALEKQCKNANDCELVFRLYFQKLFKSPNFIKKSVKMQRDCFAGFADASQRLFKNHVALQELTFQLLQSSILEGLTRPELLPCCAALNPYMKVLPSSNRRNALALFLDLALYVPESELPTLRTHFPNWLQQLELDIDPTLHVRSRPPKVVMPSAGTAHVNLHPNVALAGVRRIQGQLSQWRKLAKEIGFCDPDHKPQIRKASMDLLDASLAHCELIPEARKHLNNLADIDDAKLYVQTIDYIASILDSIVEEIDPPKTAGPGAGAGPGNAVAEAEFKMQAAARPPTNNHWNANAMAGPGPTHTLTKEDITPAEKARLTAELNADFLHLLNEIGGDGLVSFQTILRNIQ